jgi:hypothetical protein
VTALQDGVPLTLRPRCVTEVRTSLLHGISAMRVKAMAIMKKLRLTVNPPPSATTEDRLPRTRAPTAAACQKFARRVATERNHLDGLPSAPEMRRAATHRQQRRGDAPEFEQRARAPRPPDIEV